jgi:hypothetical protein
VPFPFRCSLNPVLTGKPTHVPPLLARQGVDRCPLAVGVGLSITHSTPELSIARQWSTTALRAPSCVVFSRTEPRSMITTAPRSCPSCAVPRAVPKVDTSSMSRSRLVRLVSGSRSSPHSYSSAATERGGTSVSRRKTSTAEFNRDGAHVVVPPTFARRPLTLTRQNL